MRLTVTQLEERCTPVTLADVQHLANDAFAIIRAKPTATPALVEFLAVSAAAVRDGTITAQEQVRIDAFGARLSNLLTTSPQHELYVHIVADLVPFGIGHVGGGGGAA